MVRQIMFLRTALIAAALATSVNAAAATDENDAPTHHEVGLTGELTSGDTWQLEASYHWFPIKYVGVGASFGLWRQTGYDGLPATNEWRINEDDSKVGNVFLMPSLLLKSPAIIKTADVSLGLMAEPGFMMNMPSAKVAIDKIEGTNVYTNYDRVSSNSGRWCAFSLRIGAYAAFDNITISLGYAYSSLDIYGMRRNMVYNGTRFSDFYPKRKNMGGAFLRVAYSF